MSTYKLNQKYYCDNDCKPSGCPNHEMKLEYNNTSDSYHFSTGIGRDFYLDNNQAEAMISLMKKLSEIEASAVEIK